MKRLIPLFALIAAGCSQTNYETFNQFAQGTTYRIVVKNPPEGIEKKIEATFEEIDLTFSMFNPASVTSRVNRNETDAVTPLFEECFTIAKEVHSATDGYFDSTVGPLVDAWGFGPGGAEAEPDVDTILQYVGMDKVRIVNGHIIKDDPRVRLDFSSIAKGFTVDRLALMLEAEGVNSYMVEVGGEVRVKGTNEEAGREWRIQIDKPSFGLAHEREAVIAFSKALPTIATSGNYRNWFVDEAGRTRVHIIDPKTGVPALGEILSVSIVAAECAVADAWATGIMASGTVENARRLLDAAPEGIEYYVIYGEADSTDEFHSSGFPLISQP
jgi:thiamine biosynthesis lipoprotein